MDPLELQQDYPEEQKFVVSGPTMIGRMKEIEWAVPEREMPPEFRDLESVIWTPHDTRISRNHAAIIPGEAGWEILDLNSVNGTKVNGKPIKERILLRPTYRISLSGCFELRVSGTKKSDDYHHALLVGHEGRNLRGVQRDLLELGRQLEERGFHGNVTTLFNGDATRENVLDYLDRVAPYEVPSGSHFIFHYSGHGDEEGLCLGKEKLKPEDLYPRLANIRGKKAAILDCCHAGKFLGDRVREIIPPDTLVLAGSSEHGPAFEGPDRRIAGGQYIGRFTSALVQYLESNRQQIDLRDFKSHLEREFGEAPFGMYLGRQEPLVEGTSFTVQVAHTNRLD